MAGVTLAIIILAVVTSAGPPAPSALSSTSSTTGLTAPAGARIPTLAAPSSKPADDPAEPDTTTPAEPVEVATIQETDGSIEYAGEWIRAGHPAYRGDWASASETAGATATVSFTGRSIAWIGPTGPTRGSAKVFIDGRYVRTVNTHEARFTASDTLFSASFATQRPRTLTIEVRGTANHAMVAIDAFVIRRETASPAEPAVTPTPGPAAAPTPVATPTPAPVVMPTPGPGATPTPVVVASPTLAPTPTPPAASASGTRVQVASIEALLSALADNAVDEIVVANGTYGVSPAWSQRSNALWIGKRFAGRTNPVTVRAETSGGVTFDGGGSGTFGGISFEEGAHHQTWEGFVFANGVPTETGVITFGGYQGSAGAHHITLRDVTLSRTLTSPAGTIRDHGVYFAHAVGGVHDVVIDGLTVDGRGGLDSAVHFYHSSPDNPNAWNVTIRGLDVTGTATGLIFWDRTLRNIVVEDSSIAGAGTAIQYEQGGTVTLRRVRSTGSSVTGLYSTLMSTPGQYPSGLTVIDSTFD